MKFKIVCALVAGMILIVSSTEAAKVDQYRDALANRNCSIKYEVVTKPVHQTNRMMQVKSSKFLRDIEFVDTTGEKSIEESGNFILNGNERYSELDMKQGQNPCTLVKGEDIYKFYWDIRDGQKRYVGERNAFGHSSSVKAKTIADLYAYDALKEIYNFGSETLVNALFPLLPRDRVIENPSMPKYKFVTSGTLSNGSSYEDFSAQIDNTFFAIRYYFNGDQMVKIATINFTQDNDGNVIDYFRSLIKLEEFSTIPDSKYLELPEGLKDKTKRKEKSK